MKKKSSKQALTFDAQKALEHLTETYKGTYVSPDILQKRLSCLQPQAQELKADDLKRKLQEVESKLSQKLHSSSGAGYGRFDTGNETQEPIVTNPPKDELATLYTLFAGLPPEQKKEFLNVVAWAKPVELEQSPPPITEIPDEDKTTWAKKFKSTSETQPATLDLSPNASALEIMQQAYNAFVEAAPRVTRENGYDLIICNNIKNDFGDVIASNLKRICGATEEDKLTIVRGTTSYVSRTTGEKPKFPTAFIKIEKKDGGLENLKITHQDKKEIQVLNK